MALFGRDKKKDKKAGKAGATTRTPRRNDSSPRTIWPN